MQTQAHTTAQPGLRGHSWNSEDDLLKQYLFMVETEPGKGWLGVASFDELHHATAHYVTMRNEGDWRPVRVYDQFSKYPDSYVQWSQ